MEMPATHAAPAMRVALRVLLCALILPLALPARADPYPQYGACDSGGLPALHRVEITGGTTASTAYVDDENYVFGNGTTFWLETNGVWVPKLPGAYLVGTSNADLQVGGDSFIVPGDSWICTDDARWGADAWIF
jgi:hypothetical protein